jgi:hypothetical protein
MSARGHSRRFGLPSTTSGLPLRADLVTTGRHVSKVPTPDWALSGIKGHHSHCRLIRSTLSSRLRAIQSSDNPTYVAGRERYFSGLRLAGVPEG